METKLLTIYKVTSKDELEELEISKKAFHPKRVVLVLDNMNNSIWVVKGKQSSNKLAYNAGLAATKLNAQNGFRYKIDTIEPSETEAFISKLLKQYEEYKEGKPLPIKKEEKKTKRQEKKVEKTKEPIPAPPIKVEEDKIEVKKGTPVKEISNFGITYVDEETKGEKSLISETGLNLPPLPVLLLSMGYNILAKELIYTIDKERLPSREELRKKLINTIDDILEELYTS